MTDPNRALQALLQPAALKNVLFPPNSRYAGTDTATLEVASPAPAPAPGGAAIPTASFSAIKADPAAAAAKIVYLRRRFVPPPEQFALLQQYVVAQGDRPDNLAAQFLGDPLLSWRLFDANGVMRPEELTDTVGRTLRITLPQGIPGIGAGGGNA